MEFAINYLISILPIDIINKISSYEPTSRVFYTQLELDNYLIRQKFCLCKQINKPNGRNTPDRIILNYADRWTNIIKYKRIKIVNYCV